MSNPSENRIFSLICLLMVLSVFVWCYLFRFFLDASAPLQGDAYPYLGHIRFYVENMMRGVYPLWDPTRENGNFNEFFLRRIGEFNPFFWLIAFLNKSGIPFAVAHRIFLGAYYFLGIAGFYLLSRRLFHDQRISFMAALLLFFSSLGAKTFESYILLEIVPAIWFFYFLIAFIQTPRRISLLGAVFGLMIINITYIPFYFYTVLSVFLFYFVIVYATAIKALYRRVKDFWSHNKMFSLVCAGLFVVSLIPGILWYQAACQGEVFSKERHAGSFNANPATVGINKVNEGGVLTYLIMDRQFVNLDKLELADFYIPLFAFLMLVAGAWVRLNRLLIFLFLFGFTIFLIGLADASCVHAFLYRHMPFFKYFRNVQFFLWLAVLPAFILFCAQQMRIFIQDCERSAVDRRWATLWVTAVHVGAAALFAHCGTVGYATYAVVIFSLGWMLGQIWAVGNQRVWILLVWAGIILQPFDVYDRLSAIYPPSPEKIFAYDFRYEPGIPSVEQANKLLAFKEKLLGHDAAKKQPYFTTRWFQEAIARFDDRILMNYQSAPFIVYDSVRRVDEDGAGFARIERSMAGFENVAFVYSDEVSVGNSRPQSKARIIAGTDKDFEALKFDANDVSVRTSFSEPKFLVRVANYHSQWRAFVDGTPAPLFRTNVFAQGLWVPAGEHLIQWRFGAPWRYALAYVFVVLYPIVLGSVLWLWFRSRASTQK